MSWTKETQVQSWRGKDDSYTVGIDSDGDVGILDDKGYSILLSPKGALQLRDWLNKQFDQKSLP